MDSQPDLIYRHTQPGKLTRYLISFPLLITTAAAIATRGSVLLLFCVALFAVLLTLFHSLTVEVDRERMQWRFGIGLIQKSVPIDQIVEAEPVTNRWWYGWGIRLTPHGWLFNVSGFEAVQIRLASGRCYRIGTDEPLRLQAAIHEAMRG